MIFVHFPLKINYANGTISDTSINQLAIVRLYALDCLCSFLLDWFSHRKCTITPYGSCQLTLISVLDLVILRHM